MRTAIFYAFERHGIEIPWPIEVGYEREWPEPDAAAKQRQREAVLARVDLFARLTEEQRREIAAATSASGLRSRRGDRPAGDPKGSRCSWCVRARWMWCSSPIARRVATIEAGGYFGEMSLLTGEPRTATVLAVGDTTVLELDADVFRRLGAADPHAIEQVGIAAVARRLELDKARDCSEDRGDRRSSCHVPRTNEAGFSEWTESSVRAPLRGSQV